MSYKHLLAESKAWLKRSPHFVVTVSPAVFATGAKWMCDMLNELNDEKIAFNATTNYTAYGLLKYGICVAASLIAAVLLFQVNVFLVPLAALIFYFCEVQLLFLFPLLIDDVANPINVSIQQTFRLGIWKTMCTVFPISIFMIVGLFNRKARFRNWHIGSLAIIIWYQYEIRNRIQRSF